MLTPTFTKAIRYFVETICLSPLRTGSTQRDSQTFLKNADDVPFMQGASLAGAFRDWEDDCILFGSPSQKSELIISDLVFEQAAPVMRPRVRINGKTGTAALTGKFDVAALPTDTMGKFQIIWTGNAELEDIAPRIEKYLSALNSGDIILGALKSNGFGRVAFTAKRRCYDMTNPSDLEAWLLDDEVTDAQAISLAPLDSRYIRFQVQAKMPELLVKSASGDRSIGGSTFTPFQENGAYLVPSSALKGSIRSHMARICTALSRDPHELDRLFGCADQKGANGIAGILRFSDGTMENPKIQTMSRIRINRLTGGVAQKNLLTSDSVHSTLGFEIRIPADHPAGCALLLYALRDLGLGLYELGSGTTVGYGRASWLKITICNHHNTATLYCRDGRAELTDPNEITALWHHALKEGDPL